MRLCRYDDRKLGRERDARVHDVSPVHGALGVQSYPGPGHDLLVTDPARLEPIIEGVADRTREA